MNGAEAAKPIITQMKNATQGIINCAEGESCASNNGGPGTNPFDVLAVTKQIEELKKQVDAVVVIFHGGREYVPSPPPYVINALRQFADAGASAVIAHHPHVPQGVEIHSGVPIAYSQGNFVFRWADTREDYRYFVNTGYLVHLDFAEKVLSQFSLTPYRMKDIGVFALQGDDKTQLLNELKQVSELLKDETKTRQAWNAVVETQGEKYLRNLVQNLLHQFEEDSEAAAARLHNVFFCPAHREQMMYGLKRLSHGELGDSPEWAKELVTDWSTRPLR
jgi:poly-gamma-glutamate synthesis protein (capsule biosynthesis protein)